MKIFPKTGHTTAMQFALVLLGMGSLTACVAAEKSPSVMSDAELDKALLAVEKEVNARAPIMADPETRMDSIKAGPGRKLTYFYTLINVSSEDMSAEQLQEGLEAQVKPTACASKEMQVFIKNNVQLVMKYRGKDDVPMAEIVLSQDDCKPVQ